VAQTQRRRGSGTAGGGRGQVDVDQLAALHRLRATFGAVEVLAVVDHEPAPTGSDQPVLFDADAS
jgi:hypothetical protein